VSDVTNVTSDFISVPDALGGPGILVVVGGSLESDAHDSAFRILPNANSLC